MTDQLQLGVWEPTGGLWAVSVICNTPERGVELGRRWFSPAKGNLHVGAPVELHRPCLSAKVSCAFGWGKVEEGSNMTH